MVPFATDSLHSIYVIRPPHGTPGPRRAITRRVSPATPDAGFFLNDLPLIFLAMACCADSSDLSLGRVNVSRGPATGPDPCDGVCPRGPIVARAHGLAEIDRSVKKGSGPSSVRRGPHAHRPEDQYGFTRGS